MSLEFLSGHVDLHLGGIDLRFPHHENERAQSNALVGGEAVDCWLHGEHLLFEGRKMSKSSGNVVLVKDVVDRGFDPLAIRFCFMENRYRSQMDLSWNSISAANSLLRRWRERYQEWGNEGSERSERVELLAEEILGDFLDDLDTPKALIKLRNLEKSDWRPGEKRALFEEIDSLFGLELLEIATEDLSAEVAKMLEARAEARRVKDFAKSDELRDQLLSLGIEVRDTADGQLWNKRTT